MPYNKNMTLEERQARFEQLQQKRLEKMSKQQAKQKEEQLRDVNKREKELERALQRRERKKEKQRQQKELEKQLVLKEFPEELNPKDVLVGKKKYNVTSVEGALARMVLADRPKDEMWTLYCKTAQTPSETDFKRRLTAARKLIKRYQNEGVETYIKKNLEKVQYIIEDSMVKQDYNMVLKAVELYNKCSGEGNKVQILTNDTAIQVTFAD